MKLTLRTLVALVVLFVLGTTAFAQTVTVKPRRSSPAPVATPAPTPAATPAAPATPAPAVTPDPATAPAATPPAAEAEPEQLPDRVTGDLGKQVVYRILNDDGKTYRDITLEDVLNDLPANNWLDLTQPIDQAGNTLAGALVANLRIGLRMASMSDQIDTLRTREERHNQKLNWIIKGLLAWFVLTIGFLGFLGFRQWRRYGRIFAIIMLAGSASMMGTSAYAQTKPAATPKPSVSAPAIVTEQDPTTVTITGIDLTNVVNVEALPGMAITEAKVEGKSLTFKIAMDATTPTGPWMPTLIKADGTKVDATGVEITIYNSAEATLLNRVIAVEKRAMVDSKARRDIAALTQAMTGVVTKEQLDAKMVEVNNALTPLLDGMYQRIATLEQMLGNTVTTVNAHTEALSSVENQLRGHDQAIGVIAEKFDVLVEMLKDKKVRGFLGLKNNELLDRKDPRWAQLEDLASFREVMRLYTPRK